VLLLAESCNPEWPSLPTVAYQLARAISDHVPTVVVTQIRNQKALARAGMRTADVVCLNTEAVSYPLHRLSTVLRGGKQLGWSLNTALNYLDTLAFEWTVWRRFRQDLLGRRFDIVHRLTPMSPTLASPFAGWSPIPYVLGPVNGGLAWPQAFSTERRRERDWLTHVRAVHKHLPYYRSTYANADVILAAFEHTMKDLPASALPRMINFPEVGFDPEIFFPPAADAPRRMDVLLVGRLAPCKLPEVVVRAFASRRRLRDHRLIIIGDGPERPRVDALIRQHDLQGCVEIRGQLSHREVARCMRGAGILAFPSIKELGGNVVVEAMACGMACVVTDYGGPGALVDGERGVKVSLGNVDQLVGDFASQLEALVTRPERVGALGRRAQRHAVRNYAWAAKARQIADIYREAVLRRHGTRGGMGAKA
jgi:glycosyltransferase involved in cell wall biosynthesis